LVFSVVGGEDRTVDVAVGSGTAADFCAASDEQAFFVACQEALRVVLRSKHMEHWEIQC